MDEKTTKMWLELAEQFGCMVLFAGDEDSLKEFEKLAGTQKKFPPDTGGAKHGNSRKVR